MEPTFPLLLARIVSGGRLFGRTSAVGTSQEPTKTCFDAPRAALSDPRTCPTQGHLKSRKPKSPRCCKLAREQAAWPQAAWRRPARSRTFRSGARCFLRSLSAGRFAGPTCCRGVLSPRRREPDCEICVSHTGLTDCCSSDKSTPSPNPRKVSTCLSSLEQNSPLFCTTINGHAHAPARRRSTKHEPRARLDRARIPGKSLRA